MIVIELSAYCYERHNVIIRLGMTLDSKTTGYTNNL